jgi:hypothetical protein
MPEREALVVTCVNPSFGALPFLPDLGREVFGMLTNSDHGNCCTVNSTLKENLTRDEFEAEFLKAFRGAADRRRDLIFYYLGHGHHIRNTDKFYLVCVDSAGVEKLANLADLVARAYSIASHTAGVTVVLDTCFSGGIAAEVVGELVNRISFGCMAAVAEGSAYNGCFSRSLIQIVTAGLDNVADETLGCERLQGGIRDLCPTQSEPVVSNVVRRGSVPYVARNVRAPVKGELGIRGMPLPAEFQPTAVLEKIARASNQKDVVHVIGPRGTGKTALARALAEPGGITGFVPKGFVQAIAFLDSSVTPGNLAEQLGRQLRLSSPEFAACRRAFENDAAITERERRALPPLRRHVVEPARCLPASASLRIVLSGIHRLRESVTGQAILRSLGDLAGIRGIRLVIFSEDKEGLPGAGPHVIQLGWADPDDLLAYLKARGVDEARQQVILEKSGRNWEMAAQLVEIGSEDPTELPSVLPGVYEAMLDDVHLDRTGWTILGILAAAGSGAVLPFSVLAAALHCLEDSADAAAVRGLLGDAGRLVGPEPGADALGLSFPDMAEEVLQECAERIRLDRSAFDRALSCAVAALVPKGVVAPRDPLFRYAWAREPEHLWNQERYGDLISSLHWRESPYTAEQLKRWQGWEARLREKSETRAAETLFAGCEVARLSLDLLLRTAKPGREELAQARAAYRRAVAALAGAYGLSRRECLVAVLDWVTLECNSHENALRVSKGVLRRMSGWSADDPDRLSAEYAVILQSRYLLKPGHGPALLEQAAKLLERIEANLGIDSRLAMELKGIIASLVARESPVQGVAAYTDLLQRQLALLGSDSEDVLTTKHALVFYKRRAGLGPSAYDLAQTLVDDQVRYFGGQYPDTLATRLMVADLGGFTRMVPVADTRARMETLLRDAEEVLEPDHELRMNIRTRLAFWTAKSGDRESALALTESVCTSIGNAREQGWQRLAHRMLRALRRSRNIEPRMNEERR